MSNRRSLENQFGMKTILIVSDATGDTADRIVHAGLEQFSNAHVDVQLHSQVRRAEDLLPIIQEAARIHALVIFTIVDDQVRQLLLAEIKKHKIEAIDLMGEMVTKLSRFLAAEPARVPGLLHAVNPEYFRRIEAIEYTVKHDDGAQPHSLPDADIVIVGVSRTSKTPLSMYLAQKGLRVANIPLVLGIDPPSQLLQVATERIFGLIIQTPTLMRIRQTRLEFLGIPHDNYYATQTHIDQELAFARTLFSQHPYWPVIDVTNKAIEETASDILRLYNRKLQKPRNDRNDR